jgi:deoxyribonucleoside regulator
MISDFILFEIAKLYYIDKVKQKEIALIYNINPMHVSRLLKKAEENNIITIMIKNPYRLDMNLGTKIKNKFYLKECIVLKDLDSNDITSVEDYTSQYLLGLMYDEGIFGFSWGKAISEIAKRLPANKLSTCNIFQITGGFNSNNSTVLSPSEVVNLIARKFECKSWTLNVPLFVNSIEVKKQLINNPINNNVFEMASRSFVNLIGASDLTDNATSIQVGAISKEDYDELFALKSVGDVAGYFLDSDGLPLKWSKSDLMMSIPLEVIKKAPNVICAASGNNKAKVIKAALKQKYFNILITTENIAKELL